MGNLLNSGSRAVRGRAIVQTPSVIARYLDDLRFAEQAKALDRHFGRIPPEGGMFDNIDLPELPDPVAAERAITGAPRQWLERADMTRAMEPQPAPPLTDMLLDNERRRALIAGRLDRLTPEQRARSLPSVGRQYEADQAAARAAAIKAAEDRKTLAAMAALGAAGAGAFAGRVMQEADEQERLAPLERDMQVADFVRSSIDDLRIEDDSPIEPPMTYDPEARVEDLFRDDYKVTLDMDTPEQTAAMAPGPAAPVGVNADMEDLPGPQMRSVRALMRAGIPSGRAMDIIQGRANMSPEEYRMVTGGRR